MEHENITVQFMAARMQKLMSGGWPGGGVPYGYVSANKELVVVPEAADLVRLIYQKYLEPDMKLNTVVGWLNENGYKRVVKGEDKVITSDFVSSVLGNPVYYGMIVYNRRTNSEEIEEKSKKRLFPSGGSMRQLFRKISGCRCRRSGRCCENRTRRWMIQSGSVFWQVL